MKAVIIERQSDILEEATAFYPEYQDNVFLIDIGSIFHSPSSCVEVQNTSHSSAISWEFGIIIYDFSTI
jgi:hypothetical protein